MLSAKTFCTFVREISSLGLQEVSFTFIPNALSTKDLGFDGFGATAIVSEPQFGRRRL